ncbi:hypothetical protein [Mycolicibacterium mengxianglii]|uniref:hypothetical protein n=1 Tax=Mycolicibacterium mengxianglii TaxID=2736649 RepID=UPI0018D108C6|nr:hypothetical protein [Mycolicibacterium mengxianglii]
MTCLLLNSRRTSDVYCAGRNRRLTRHLGPVGIVFMVVAAAAPLTVIGGNMPLAIARWLSVGALAWRPSKSLAPSTLD